VNFEVKYNLILVWDTARQKRYLSIKNIFYKYANAVKIVFDIIRMNSFEEIKNYWYQQTKDN